MHRLLLLLIDRNGDGHRDWNRHVNFLYNNRLSEHWGWGLVILKLVRIPRVGHLLHHHWLHGLCLLHHWLLLVIILR